jgi:polar amino acid transport system substrate-binding protein
MKKMNPASKDALQELVPQGVLRAAINLGNPVLAQMNPESGEACGVSVDLARELAKRLVVPTNLVYCSPLKLDISFR